VDSPEASGRVWAIHAGFEGKTDEERIKCDAGIRCRLQIKYSVVSIRAFGKANDKEATKPGI